MDKALLALWTGSRLSITTPTGKEFEALEEDGEIVIIEDDTGYTVSGEQASQRLKKCLMALGTEWDAKAPIEERDRS